MARKNEYERNVKSTNPFVDSVSMPGDGGVFGANPAPGFRDYKETVGKVLPPKKFAETDMSESRGTKVNNMQRDVETPSISEEMGIQKPGTSRIIKGRNRYQTEVRKGFGNK